MVRLTASLSVKYTLVVTWLELSTMQQELAKLVKQSCNAKEISARSFGC